MPGRVYRPVLPLVIIYNYVKSWHFKKDEHKHNIAKYRFKFFAFYL